MIGQQFFDRQDGQRFPVCSGSREVFPVAGTAARRQNTAFVLAELLNQLVYVRRQQLRLLHREHKGEQENQPVMLGGQK
ncbi:hypothetical protein D3C86_1937410 [compost metagenome]